MGPFSSSPSLLGLLLMPMVLMAGCVTQRPRVESMLGLTMGSTWSVKSVATASAPDRLAVQRELQQRLDDLERQMSTWRADSALSRFNAVRDTNWFSVPHDTAVVVSAALDISRLTDGAFDVTMFPVLQLWGFGPGGKKGTVPGDEAIAAARRLVDWRRLHVRLDPPALRKEFPELSVDLSALAPGHAADVLAVMLHRVGRARHLVNVGGEMRAGGDGPVHAGWSAAIELPRAEPRTVAATVALRHASLATSGDYRAFFTVGGRRFSHFMDPRTGWPAESALASVSVVDSSAMHADALATALMVLGPERGWELAQRERLGALFISRAGDGFILRATEWFPQRR